MATDEGEKWALDEVKVSLLYAYARILLGLGLTLNP